LDEVEDIPKELQTKFHELYSMAYKTNEKLKMVHATELLTELDIAISADDSLKQWNLINQLRKLYVYAPNILIELLYLNTIHPVVKTTIFNWLKEIRYEQEV